MEKIKEFIGIDISKLKFDVRIYSNQKSSVFTNNPNGFKTMIEWVNNNTSASSIEILYALEHTGIYSLPISIFFSDNGLKFVLISGLEIKRSLGIQRGKDDKIDAKRIAEYAFQKRDKIKLSRLPLKNILTIRRLLTLRDRLVKHRSGFLKDCKENEKFINRKENKMLFAVIEKSVKEIDKQILRIENELDKIISADELIQKQYNLILSINGVGRQTALTLIVYTNCFTNFDKWRKLASYAGTAPYKYRSGTSIKGRSKVSQLANKKIKTLLNMCARSAITCNPELKFYYQKRKAQGENGMSIMNIIRNKLLSRIFAVVKRETPYVNTFKYAA